MVNNPHYKLFLNLLILLVLNQKIKANHQFVYIIMVYALKKKLKIFSQNYNY